MTYVITRTCIDVKDGACVEVCPVDCIYEGGRMFYIHPHECIACGICETFCPVEAIYRDDEVPAEQRDFIRANAEYFDDSVSGLGAPGGAAEAGARNVDHPQVAAEPCRRG